MKAKTIKSYIKAILNALSLFILMLFMSITFAQTKDHSAAVSKAAAEHGKHIDKIIWNKNLDKKGFEIIKLFKHYANMFFLIQNQIFCRPLVQIAAYRYVE